MPRNAHVYRSARADTDTPPETPITLLLDRAFEPGPLTRAEKDAIAAVLYGDGRTASAYRLGGWTWPMDRAPRLRRVLVADAHERDVFRTFWAADKTALVKVLGQREMLYTELGVALAGATPTPAERMFPRGVGEARGGLTPEERADAAAAR